MRLIYTADRKRFDNPLVRALAGNGVFIIKRALMLIDHDAVVMQSLIAVPIKLTRKKPLTGSKRIGRIDDNQVILIVAVPNKF